MKRIFDAIGWRPFLILALPLLLASCQPYDNTIRGRGISPSGIYRPADSLDLEQEAEGFIHIDRDHAGNPLISDSLYTISPTWQQAWKWAGERNDRALFWLGLALFVIPIGIFIYLTSTGSNSKALVVLPAFAIIVGGGLMGGSLEWEKWNMDQTITKARYVDLLQDPGNLGPFWDNIRAK